MPHRLELFSSGCPLCVSFQREVEVGKCGPCELEVIDVRDPSAKPRMEAYGVRVVPTLVVDAAIKVEGRLDQPWMCGDEFYAMLAQRYPLANARLKERSGPTR
ncbi:MAG TPA: thioredoxin family protein [Candidatus Thermoplasmatota archaeon]|nr:thioredoxin family protein [Candidatus Thermoplasmatota archaeon]